GVTATQTDNYLKSTLDAIHNELKQIENETQTPQSTVSPQQQQIPTIIAPAPTRQQIPPTQNQGLFQPLFTPSQPNTSISSQSVMPQASISSMPVETLGRPNEEDKVFEVSPVLDKIRDALNSANKHIDALLNDEFYQSLRTVRWNLQ